MLGPEPVIPPWRLAVLVVRRGGKTAVEMVDPDEHSRLITISGKIMTRVSGVFGHVGHGVLTVLLTAKSDITEVTQRAASYATVEHEALTGRPGVFDATLHPGLAPLEAGDMFAAAHAQTQDIGVDAWLRQALQDTAVSLDGLDGPARRALAKEHDWNEAPGWWSRGSAIWWVTAPGREQRTLHVDMAVPEDPLVFAGEVITHGLLGEHM